MTPTNSNSPALASFCKNRASFKIKFALLSFYAIPFSKFAETFILLLEYLQFMSQIILSPSTNYDHPAFTSFIFDVIVYFFKLINPAYLLTFQDSDPVISSVLAILFFFTILKLALFGYIVFVSLWNYRINSMLAYFWRWIFKLQTRVIYFILSSFWTRTIIEAREEGFYVFGMSKAVLITISSLVLAIEFLISIGLETHFCYVLPTDSFLSSKNNSLQIITIFQKMFIQVLTIILRSDSVASAWVTCSVGLVMTLIREDQFTRKFPLYHIKALVFQRMLLSVVISLNLALFIKTILKETSSRASANINFVILTWIVISLLCVKGGHEYLKGQIMRLLFTIKNIENSSPEMLLHKAYISQELRAKEVQPGKKSIRCHWTHLVMTNQRVKILKSLKEGNSNECIQDIEEINDEKMDKLSLLYFEDLLKKLPKNFLINIHTAYTRFKNKEPFSGTIKLATQIQHSKWSSKDLNLSLLLYEIEKSMLKDQQEMNNNERELNFYMFIESKLFVDDIKNKMLKQTNLYLKVCANLLGDTANLEEIYSSGQDISKLKAQIQKAINISAVSLPQYNISPLLCFAKYYSVVNHSSMNSDKYFQIFNQQYFKFEKKFKEGYLLEENLYQDRNAFVLLSTEKLNYGKILFCNSSLVTLCGGNNIKGYLDSHFSRIFPPTLQLYYDNVAKESLNVRSLALINKTYRTYLYHKEKYIIEADFCLKYHPYLAQGLCMDMIIRPVPVNPGNEFLLLKEDGTIEGASRKLSKFLKLNTLGPNNENKAASSLVAVKSISQELDKINTAFNMIIENYGIEEMENIPLESPLGSPDSMLNSSMRKMSMNKAVGIYKEFSSGSQKLQLYPYEKDLAVAGCKNEPHTFYAQVKVIAFGNITMKLVSLRSTATRGENNNGQSNIFFEEENVKSLEKLSPPENFETKDLKEGDSQEGGEGSENVSIEEQEEEYARRVSIFDQQLTTNANLMTSPIQTQPDVHLLTSPTSETKRFFRDGEMSSPRKGTTFLISQRNERSPQHLNTIVSSSDNIFEEERIGRLNSKNKGRAHQYTSSKHSSKKSTEKASDKAFKIAIITKSYPKLFTILCIVLYGGVLLTFIAQLVMKNASDTTMEDLQIKKSLLKSSQERSYKACLLFINAVGSALQIEGALESGGLYLGVEKIIENMQLRMKDMKEANDQMLQYVNYLDQEFQHLLFFKDVGIKGTYLDSLDNSYKQVNTFQATQEIINGVQTLDSLKNATCIEAFNIFNYLTLNIANDYQYKNIQITDIFIRSVTKQKQAYQATIDLCLILPPFLLGGLGVLLIFIIWNQYRLEKRNLKDFIKISPTGVKDVSEQLMKFKRSLVNEESFESKWFSDRSEDFEIMPEFEYTSAYSKKHNTQIIKYDEFRRRYVKYIGRVVFYIAILVSITIWDLASTQKAIKIIYNRQGQLQFANHIMNQASTSYTSFVMLYLKNDTMSVEHKLASKSLSDSIIEVQRIQTEIPSKFLEIDKTYNPQVKAILFDNNPKCKGFPLDNIHNCVYLLGIGQPVNLLVANSAFLSFLKMKNQTYPAAKYGTKDELLDSAYENMQTMLANFVLLAHEAKTITDIMDETLTEKISDNKDARTTIIIVFSIALAVISALIWIDILRVIRNVYNDFKKVLQVFPPNLILSSYILKNFLRQTADQPLFN